MARSATGPAGKSDGDLKESIRTHIRRSLAIPEQAAGPRDHLKATSLAVRDLLVERMLDTLSRYEKADAKRLYYLSMEFLMGRALGNALHNLGIFSQCKRAVAALGADLEEICELEPDAALGNGGLGRLAACFLDSLATLGMPGFGYGINYEFGLFSQTIFNGEQRERPDNWLSEETPWLIETPFPPLTQPSPRTSPSPPPNRRPWSPHRRPRTANRLPDTRSPSPSSPP